MYIFPGRTEKYRTCQMTNMPHISEIATIIFMSLPSNEQRQVYIIVLQETKHNCSKTFTCN